MQQKKKGGGRPTLSVLSSEPVSRCRPSREKETVRTVPECALMTVDLPSLLWWTGEEEGGKDMGALHRGKIAMGLLGARRKKTYTVGNHRRTVRSFEPDAMSPLA